MRTTAMLALAAGLAALAACDSANEQVTDNMDANLVMPADNFDTMEADAADETAGGNLAADSDLTGESDNVDATSNTAAANTSY